MLLVAPQPFYTPRGTPMNVLQMCRVLTGAGYRVDLATYPLGEDVSMSGLTVHRALPVPGVRSVPIGFSKRKVLLDGALCLLVVSLILRRRYAAVHAVEESVFLAAPVTWLGTPLIYDLDSLISDQLAYSGAVRSPLLLRGVRALERWVLGRSCGAITVCTALTEAAHRLSPDTPIYQIEDSPLAECLRDADPAAVQALRVDLGLADRPTVVYTGNLESYQGIELLLAGTRLLVRQSPAAAIVLVGGEADQVAALEQQMRDEGLGGNVFAVGKRPPDQMPEWMALGQALVSPRQEGENTPLKIYTYMRSGVSIVATRLATHTQVLDDRTAWLCPPTPEGLAEAMGQALASPGRGAEIAARARARVESKFSFEAFSRKLLAAYRQMLPQPAD